MPKVSALPAGATLTGTETFVIDQSGATVTGTAAQVAAYVASVAAFRSLTTTGSGAASLSSGVLNIPTPAAAGTVTSVSVTTANGVSGTVANATTTPAISLTLGAITPTTVNKVTFTPPTTGATLTLGDTKTVTVSNTLTLAGTDSTTMTFPEVSANVGFREVPSNSQSAAYTCVSTDSGKSIDHPASDANARTFTIPANSSVAYPVGTCITFTNMTSQVVSIAITTDTMYLAGTGTTGTRSLAQYGIATARKLTSTTWIISGAGLT